MIICSSSNIDLIQGVTGYGTVGDGVVDWRIENTATGVFNVLNSPNLLAPNLSIIESGNVGIGTIPGTGTNKLQVQGNANVSGDTLSKTYTATNTTAGTNDIFTMRYDTTNGLRFQQTLIAVNDVRYDVIQKTNNVDSTTPAMSFYKGNVGIGTTNPNAELQVSCASTATNPDTPGTIIGLYVHNPTNSASQNSVIYNRIGGTSAGKVIYAFNVLSSYGCSLVINGNDATNRLLRFNNSSDASGTDLMVINNTNGNVSIGNTTTDTHRLNVTGSVNVSGGYLVGGNALKPATAVLADTATVLAANRNIAGVPFNGSGAIDIPYFNLTNKITAGTGISLTTGSASSSPTISTNLTAGTNVTFTGTAPNITINASGGGTSQWITTGNNIYYNTGNVGIGTDNPFLCRLQINHDSSTTYGLRVINPTNLSGNNSVIFNSIGGTSANKVIYTFDVSGAYGYSILMKGDSSSLWFNSGGIGNGTDTMVITSTGNVGIGTNNPGFRLEVSGQTTSGTFNAFALYIGGTGSFNQPWASTCAKFNGDIWSTSSFFSSSDSRIKEDIQDINDDNALQSILSIEPKTYKYVDKLEKGDKKVYGFIAQQIKEVIPEAITIENSYIPNIYSVAHYNSNVITLSSQPTKVVIKVNDKIKCYDKDNKELLIEVIEVIDGLTFRIKEIEYTDTKIFVYGTFVDDFHTLDKTYIFTLNVCATQELHRRIEAQSVLLKSQDDRIKDLETKVATLMSNT